MKARTTSRFHKILRILTWIIVVLTLGVCAVPFISDGEFWLISMLGLGFLFIFIALLIFCIIWAFQRSYWMILPLATLALSYKQISVLFGHNLTNKEFVTAKSAETLRVMSWNVLRMDEHNRKKRGGISFRPAIIQSIVDQQADVVCLQEFFEPSTNRYFRQNIDTLEQLGFAYHYFVPTSITVNGEYKYGMAIFSRHPIIDTAATGFTASTHSEGLIYADIKFQGSTVRIFSVHMESFRGSKYGYMEGGGGVQQMAGTFQKTYWTRNAQAKRVRAAVEASPYPSVVCGNLGDVPNSYAYFTVRGDMRDAFLQKGAGLGSTFRYFLPTLRLDYLLVDQRLKVLQYDMPRLEYSDHYPLITDLQLR